MAVIAVAKIVDVIVVAVLVAMTVDVVVVAGSISSIRGVHWYRRGCMQWQGRGTVVYEDRVVIRRWGGAGGHKIKACWKEWVQRRQWVMVRRLDKECC